MGGKVSKAARRTLKRPEPPSWAGVRSPNPGELNPMRPPPKASETKNEAIERDAIDPHFLSMLKSVGPVKVDHHMQTFRTDERIRRAHESLLQSEREASSLQQHPPDRMSAASLSALLDARRAVGSRDELKALAQKTYGVDVAALESLARYVNTPSAPLPQAEQGASGEREQGSGDGEKAVNRKAIWVDPPWV